jgi:hypothetical protein
MARRIKMYAAAFAALALLFAVLAAGGLVWERPLVFSAIQSLASCLLVGRQALVMFLARRGLNEEERRQSESDVGKSMLWVGVMVLLSIVALLLFSKAFAVAGVFLVLGVVDVVMSLRAVDVIRVVEPVTPPEPT